MDLATIKQFFIPPQGYNANNMLFKIDLW